MDQAARRPHSTPLTKVRWRQARDFHARKVPRRAFRSPATSGEYPAKPGEGGRNTFDPPLWAMFEPRQFWEGHWVMNEEPCWHLENPCHSHQIGQSHSFKLAVLPIRWVDTTAAPVRAVVILER